MSDYDFSTINSNEFEKLVCDLLNTDSSLTKDNYFRNFKRGKDQGIDLLLSTMDNEKEVVVQVKHYLKSSFSTLKSKLAKEEVPKVNKLKPQKYLFVTSQELSLLNKQQIKEIFSPHIKNILDIYGREDLNNLLQKNKHIEERHFKLWLSSTIAIQKIHHYKFFGRQNEFQENVIKQKLRLFVVTREHFQAIETLENNHFLIITGEPGVGKTTLSEILIYRYISKNYELFVIYDDIREIEQTLRDDESKQIFYFDDFLGHTQAEIQKSKSAETYLLKIISRIENSKNKFLILNTRKFILNSFLDESERFRNFNPLKAETNVELCSYSYGAKRRMLDNHINEFQLSSDKIEILKELAFLICNHKNFSPRYLEFFSNNHHIGNLNKSSYRSFIIENLENPKKIWEHAYSKQISDNERFLLNSLYSLNSRSSKKHLELAFNSRIEYEVKKNNHLKSSNPFYDSFKILNNGFITNFNHIDYIEINFINPSLEDFLRYYINNNYLELTRILSSSISIDQWMLFFQPFDNKNIDNHLIELFKSKFTNNELSDKDKYKSVLFIFSYSRNNSHIIKELLSNISDWEFIDKDTVLHSYTIKFLKKAIQEQTLIPFISKIDSEYFLKTILNCYILAEAYDIINLFKNNLNLDFTTKSSPLSKGVYSHYKELLYEEIELQYNFLFNSNIYENEHLDVIERIENHIKFIRSTLLLDFTIDYDILLENNWNEIALRNKTDPTISLSKKHSIEEESIHDFNYYDFDYDFDYDYEYDYEYEYYNKQPITNKTIDLEEGFLDDLPF